MRGGVDCSRCQEGPVFGLRLLQLPRHDGGRCLELKAQSFGVLAAYARRAELFPTLLELPPRLRELLARLRELRLQLLSRLLCRSQLRCEARHAVLPPFELFARLEREGGGGGGGGGASLLTRLGSVETREIRLGA